MATPDAQSTDYALEINIWSQTTALISSNLDTILKVLNSPTKLAQLGKIKGLLNEVKRKVKEREPQKDWEYEPIFEYKFRKLNFFQTIHNEQAKVESSIQASILTATSPLDMDVLQLDTDDEYQNSETDTEVENLSFLDGKDDSRNMLEDRCTALHCIKENSAQCQDVVHSTPLFNCESTDNRVVSEHENPKRSISPTIAGFVNIPPAITRSPRACLVPKVNHARIASE